MITKILIPILLIISTFVNANDTTYVNINLNLYSENELKITLYSPDINTEQIDYIIPQIIPGTYMKINYHRFYSKFKAYSKNGKELPVHKKGNHIIIKKAKQLYRLEYFVKQSFGDKKIWDNIIGCAGTIFKKGESFLINYQLITGYFEGYNDNAFQIKFTKPDSLYGSTSLKKSIITPKQDICYANNYAKLIDNPILYAKADTSSFNVDDTRFNISVYSETKKITSEQLKPKLNKIINSIKDYYNILPIKKYHFIFYYTNGEDLGTLESFGLGSALEHLNSSIYYLAEHSDTTFRYNNWICTHEFLHTYTPLTIRSEKISNFNFDNPNMSKHLWFYEGFTDYSASLIVQRYKLPYYYYFRSAISYATQTAKQLKSRSMTKSSENIINHNVFDWFSKIRQISNFYEKGKLISFCLDVEIYKLSDGKMRLTDLIHNLQMKYSINKPFNDEDFFNIIVENSYPEIREFINKYIIDSELVPYQEYFSIMGWKFYEKGEKIPSFGNIYTWRDKKTDKFYIKEVGKNTFGLLNGDTILSVNGKEINSSNYYYDFYLILKTPIKNEQVQIIVSRAGNEIILNGIANKKRKIKYSVIYDLRNQTEKQKQFRKHFF